MAQSRSELWLEASQAYQDENYQQAIDLYTELSEQGYRSAALYANLGNAFYKENMIAGAVLNFERSLKLNPSNKEVRQNLSLAQSRIENSIVEVEMFFLVSWVLAITNAVSTFTWGVLCLVLLWLSIIVFSRPQVPATKTSLPTPRNWPGGIIHSCIGIRKRSVITSGKQPLMPL